MPNGCHPGFVNILISKEEAGRKWKIKRKMKRRYTCIKMNLCVSSKQAGEGRRWKKATSLHTLNAMWLVSPWSIISCAWYEAPLMNFNIAAAMGVTRVLDTASAKGWNKQSLSNEISPGCHEGQVRWKLKSREEPEERCVTRPHRNDCDMKSLLSSTQVDNRRSVRPRREDSQPSHFKNNEHLKINSFPTEHISSVVYFLLSGDLNFSDAE